MAKKLTLKQLRAGTNLRQAEAAKLLGVNLPTYNAWEQFSEEDLRNIAKLYKVSPADIVVPKPSI